MIQSSDEDDEPMDGLNNVGMEMEGDHGNERGTDRFMVWNCQGAASATFCRHFKSFCQENHPCVVALFEPCLSGSIADRVVSQLVFPNLVKVEAYGFSGGV
ncbi:hypothetical protein GQ457_02G028540 [Hibiscus cannabinus]